MTRRNGRLFETMMAANRVGGTFVVQNEEAKKKMEEYAKHLDLCNVHFEVFKPVQKVKFYFASPLFTEMEREWNERVVQKLERRLKDENVVYETYLPQRNMEINDKQSYADSQMIADGDTEELLSSDVVIAVLDGQVIDPGVASEIGVAYAKGIPVIGLYTDNRTNGSDNTSKIDALSVLGENQFHYANLYTIGLIKNNGVVVSSSDEMIETFCEMMVY